MNKIIYKIFITIFIALCLIPLAGAIFNYQNTNTEKRALALKPQIIENGSINTQYTKQYDDYFTDNFALRPDFVTLYAIINKAAFNESVSDQVIIGKDGWLFFTPTLNDYIKKDVMSDNEIARITKSLLLQQQYIKDKGCVFIFTVAPNKASIYGQYMPERFKTIESLSNIEKLAASLDEAGVEYIDLFEILKEESGDAQLYHKLDTHWNNTGALLAYNAILDEVEKETSGFTYDSHNNLSPAIEKNWPGDLSDMLYPALGLLDYQPLYDIEQQYHTGRTIRSFMELNIETENEAGTKNLLMFRDSFASALIPIMSNEFKTAIYSRATPYDYRLMQKDTDAVILQIAERNLSDLLYNAPLMPAPVISLEEQLAPADINTLIVTEDEGDYVRICGVALTRNYSPDENYDIYLEIDKKIYVPFPVLNQTAIPEKYRKANAAFSMIIEKRIFDSASEFNIIVSDSKGYYIGETDITLGD